MVEVEKKKAEDEKKKAEVEKKKEKEAKEAAEQKAKEVKEKEKVWGLHDNFNFSNQIYKWALKKNTKKSRSKELLWYNF